MINRYTAISHSLRNKFLNTAEEKLAWFQTNLPINISERNTSFTPIWYLQINIYTKRLLTWLYFHGFLHLGKNMSLSSVQKIMYCIKITFYLYKMIKSKFAFKGSWAVGCGTVLTLDLMCYGMLRRSIYLACWAQCHLIQILKKKQTCAFLSHLHWIFLYKLHIFPFPKWEIAEINPCGS